MNRKQAIILAGGAGTRLKALTKETPKPMIEVNGKPFLLYVVEELRKYGIADLIFCLGYLASKIERFFGDGSKFGVKISYSVEKDFIGTGGAIRLAKNLLDDEFFVINGDTYLAIDYAKAFQKFKDSGKMGLMVLYDNSEQIALPNISVGEEGLVILYSKKESLKKGQEVIASSSMKEDDCSFVDAGIQIFKKEIIGLIPPEKFVSLEVEIFPKLIDKKEMSSFITSKRYYDLGTPKRLKLIKKVLK